MTIQRREFLKAVGGASLAGTLIGGSNAALAATNDVPAFGFSDDRVPMNAANLCPMPSAVSASCTSACAPRKRTESGSS